VVQWMPGKVLRQFQIEVIRSVLIEDAQLKTFIKRWGSKGPTAQYGWAHPLTPRMVQGKDIMDYRSHVDVTNKVVWGGRMRRHPAF
jgi:hypothetical protein